MWIFDGRASSRFDRGEREAAYVIANFAAAVVVATTTGPTELSRRILQFLGVCAGTKSSGSWLREWIELQLLGGIDHVWIMNDNDAGTEDGTQAIIQFYERLGFVTIIPGPAPTQYPGCEMVNLQPGDRNNEPNCAPVKHCAAEVGDQVQWLIFADTDEFIYPHHGCSLSNFVRNTCDINRASVSLRWERFGSSGHSYQPAGLMTETFLSSGGDCAMFNR
eukprot:gene11095-17052_t